MFHVEHSEVFCFEEPAKTDLQFPQRRETRKLKDELEQTQDGTPATVFHVEHYCKLLANALSQFTGQVGATS